jgi:anti-sigma regulatory factor (Ser/Thr protein kinase)
MKQRAQHMQSGAHVTGCRTAGGRLAAASIHRSVMPSTSNIQDLICPRTAEPARASYRHDAPLPQPPPDAQAIPIVPASLPSMRATVARRADRAGLPPERRDDLVLAASELATNSIRHGGGSGTLTIWDTDAALVCQVTDAGRLADPRAGSALPAPGQIGRYGLWLVHQMCDMVEQRSLPRGNLVRVWMRRE